jgi:hypothetical protein
MHFFIFLGAASQMQLSLSAMLHLFTCWVLSDSVAAQIRRLPNDAVNNLFNPRVHFTLHSSVWLLQRPPALLSVQGLMPC